MTKHWHAALLFVFLGFALVRGIAQTNPNLETGFKPYGSYDDSDFDSVNLATGNLTVHIPLFEYPQRGNLDEQVYLVYNAKGWIVYLDCITQGNCTPLWQWRTGAQPHGIQLLGGNPESYSVSFKSVGIVDDFTATDFWGGTHQLAQLTTGGYRSIDASGLYYNGWIGLPGTTEKLLDRKGRGINYNTSWGDTNGNYVGAFGMTPDTLNRTYGGSSSSDSTGCSGSLTVTSATVWSFPAPSGGTRTVKECMVTFPVKTNFQAYTYGNDGVRQKISEASYFSGGSLVQSIIVFDGTSWSTSPQWIFEYNDRDSGDSSSINYGDLTKITLPTGGSIAYTWGKVQLCATLALTPVSRGVTSRTVTDNMGLHLTTYSSGTVTDPAGNVTVHTIPGVGGSCFPYETQTDYYKGAVAPSNLLKTVQIAYSSTANPFDQYGDGTTTRANVVVTSVTTKWPNGSNYLVSQVQTDYDNSFTFYPNSVSGGTYGLVKEKREYAYGSNAPGALLRKTDYAYAALTNTNYLNANLLDLVTQATVQDGSSHQVSQITYGYDETTLQSSGITTQHVTTLANPGYRGNQTSVKSWLNTTGGTVTTAQTQFYDTGMPYLSTDLKNNQTQYTYDPAYVGAYVTKTQYPNTGSGVTHYIQGAYDFNTGLLTSFTDQNLQASNYNYDVLGRLTSASFPDGGSVGFSYTDTVPVQVQKTVAVTGSLSKVTNTVFDGLGRTSQTQFHDPDCAVGSGLVKSDYTYGDDMSQNTHYSTASTPYCDTPGGPFGLPTRTDSDAIGRVTKVTQPDGSIITTTYAANSTTLTECATGTDEAGKARTSCADGLGRVTGVWEDPGTSPHLNYETDYGYDALDNLLSVNQKGDNSAPRARSFVYDSLSRLSSAVNPESGTISYTYSNTSAGCASSPGVVCTKTAPKPNQTGSATVVTTYNYDQLNRLTQKSYNDGTATTMFGYDGTALTGCTPAPPSLTDSYPKPNATAICDASGATSWSHDQMGRLASEKRTIKGSTNITNSITYAPYYLDGSLQNLTYPSGRIITYTLNGAAPYTASRPVSAVETAHSINYATSATYAPQGALASLTAGSSIFGGFSYNSRLQPLQIYYGTVARPDLTGTTCPSTVGNVMHRIYDFHAGTDNGNVATITDCESTDRTQNFDYDSLNRIKDGYTTGSGTMTTNWGETYTIDPWGNLTNIGLYSGKHNSETLNAAPASSKNQLPGYSYDAAGNMTSNGSTTYTYDAENRVTATSGYSYVYDANGQRVIKCGGTFPTCGSGTLYWRGTAGDPLAETDFTGAPTEEYVFFNGTRIARRDGTGNTALFYFADHLGSTDVITSSTGGVQKLSVYYPYGGEIAVTGSGFANNYKFTGKERDAESGLDNFGARYDASGLGRFMTPDPLMASGHARNPQTWNRYAYALNNPVRFVDPDGMEVPDSCAKDSKCTIVVKVNVIYDKTVNNGKGLTGQQKQTFEKDQMGKATNAYGTSNIKLDVSYTAGSYTVGSDGKTYVTGLQSNALNVVASNATPSGAAGDSEVIPKTNTAVTFINVGDAHSSNAYPLWTNTTEHELAHQFLGDVYQQPNPFSYEANEFVVDAKVAAQAAGVSQQSFRTGLEPRSYAAPQNPEAIQPQQ